MEKSKVAVEDVFYELNKEEKLLYVYIADINGKEWEIAEIDISELEEKDQEYYYNESLQIANEMGYYLTGQLESTLKEE